MHGEHSVDRSCCLLWPTPWGLQRSGSSQCSRIFGFSPCRAVTGSRANMRFNTPQTAASACPNSNHCTVISSSAANAKLRRNSSIRRGMFITTWYRIVCDPAWQQKLHLRKNKHHSVQFASGEFTFCLMNQNGRIIRQHCLFGLEKMPSVFSPGDFATTRNSLRLDVTCAQCVVHTIWLLHFIHSHHSVDWPLQDLMFDISSSNPAMPRLSLLFTRPDSKKCIIPFVRSNHVQGRSLGEVTKYLVYNMRKRQEGGDTAEQYFNCTEQASGFAHGSSTNSSTWEGRATCERVVWGHIC